MLNSKTDGVVSIKQILDQTHFGITMMQLQLPLQLRHVEKLQVKTTDWKNHSVCQGPQEVSKPISYSKHGQHWIFTTLLRALSSKAWKTLMKNIPNFPWPPPSASSSSELKNMPQSKTELAVFQFDDFFSCHRPQ